MTANLNYTQQVRQHLINKGVPPVAATLLAETHAPTGLVNGWFAVTTAATVFSFIEWYH
jgi:hypothetical protein